MIVRVLDLESVTLRQITRPLAEVVTIAAEATVAEALQMVRERGYTRLPVWQQRAGGRRIAGLISAESLMFDDKLDQNRKVVELISLGLFLSEDLRLDAALDRMQRSGQRLAVVLGRDGSDVGIVALEDILKTIFGEVRF